MNTTPPTFASPEEEARYWRERRLTDGFIVQGADGVVIYDGEAESMGIEPLTVNPLSIDEQRSPPRKRR